MYIKQKFGPACCRVPCRGSAEIGGTVSPTESPNPNSAEGMYSLDRSYLALTWLDPV